MLALARANTFCVSVSAGRNRGMYARMNAVSQPAQLLLRCRSWLCALPLADVVETMRVLPLKPVAGAPPYVRGLAMIRGELVPVVSLAALLGEDAQGRAPRGQRLVLLRAAGRRLAIEVDEVLRVLPQALPPGPQVAPLLSRALPAQVESLASLDGAALAVLSSASLLSEDAWALVQQSTRS